MLGCLVLFVADGSYIPHKMLSHCNEYAAQLMFSCKTTYLHNYAFFILTEKKTIYKYAILCPVGNPPVYSFLNERKSSMAEVSQDGRRVVQSSG